MRALAVVLTLALVCAPILVAAQTARTFADVTINAQTRGEAVVLIDGDDVYVAVTDLQAAGIRGFTGKQLTSGGHVYVSLKSLEPNVHFTFDPKALALNIQAGANLLGSTTVSVRPERPGDAVDALATSSYANYSLHRISSGELSTFFEGAHAIGTASYYGSFGTNAGHLQRGLVNATFDHVGTLQRTTVGDTVVQTGELGGGALIAGISSARHFDFDPYSIFYPTPSLVGTTLTPSVADIIVNGTLIREVELPLGNFDLRNVPISSGVANTQIVIRDAFGRTSSSSGSYYISTGLLKKGVTDYQYAAGFVRTNAFAPGDAYGPLAVAGRYRLGVTDALTGSARFEATSGLLSGGASVDTVLRKGTLHFSAAGSESTPQSGAAATFAYTSNSRFTSFSAAVDAQTAHYATLSQGASTDRALFNTSLGATVRLLASSPTTFTVTQSHYRDSGTSLQAGAQQTVRLAAGTTALFSISHTISTGTAGSGSGTTVSLTLTRPTGTLSSVTGTTTLANGVSSSVSVDKAISAGAGFGYNATLSAGAGDSLSSQLEYHDPHYSLNASLLKDGHHKPSVDTVFSGSIVSAGGNISLGPPVSDAFALVRVAGFAGVDVFVDNQNYGKTDRTGTLVVPSLRPYYASRIAISGEDTPLNTSIAGDKHTIVPHYQMGTPVTFAAHAVAAVVGKILIRAGAKTIVPAFGAVTLSGKAGEASSDLTEGGGFYFENLAPGTYAASVKSGEGICNFPLSVPLHAGIWTNIGTVTCVKS